MPLDSIPMTDSTSADMIVQELIVALSMDHVASDGENWPSILSGALYGVRRATWKEAADDLQYYADNSTYGDVREGLSLFAKVLRDRAKEGE